jgi:hypothetical protein
MLSSNPNASADVFVRRFGAKVLQEASEATNSLGFLTSNNPGCAEILSIELPAVFDHQRIQFVKDLCKAGASSSKTTIRDSLLDWNAQDQPRHGQDEYSPWTDFHDGYRPLSVVNTENLNDDMGGSYRWDGVLRGKVPDTIFSWDVPDPNNIIKSNPDLCRDKSINRYYNQAGYFPHDGWFKSTFLTLNASASFSFVHHLLDAEYIESTYPENRTAWHDQKCTHYTRWAYWNLTLVDGSNKPYMMHFVESSHSVNRTHSIDPNEFIRKVLASRALNNGLFDTWLYNSVVLEVDDISHYREKLDAQNHPYLERLLPSTPTVCGLWTSIPGTIVALQLISKTGCNLTSAIFAVDSGTSMLAKARPIAWVHVPKSGSSLANALIHLPGMCPSIPSNYTTGKWPVFWNKTYPASEYCPGSFMTEGVENPGDHSGVGSLYEKKNKSDVKGHGVIMLRQPEQRIVSAFLDNEHSWPYWYFQRNATSLAEYAHVVSGCAVRMLVRDGMSEGLERDSPSPCGGPEPATDAEVALAIQRLREGFVFVGLTDQWDLSMCLLHAMFGGDCLATDFGNSNPGSQIKNASAMYNTSGLMGYKDTADGALYEVASAIFRDQLERYGVSHASCQQCFRQAGGL